jgi:hypothetical protein
MKTLRLPLVLVLLVFIASTVRAQVGPALLQETWQRDQYFNNSEGALFEAAGHTDGAGDTDIRLSQYHALGGYRLQPGNVGSTRIGFDVLDYDVVGHDPVLPRNLMDAKLGFVQPITTVNDWFVVLTGTVGSASNEPFSDGSGVYGGGDVIIGHRFRKDDYLFIGIDYDGNRTFLPDTPIPGFAYAGTYNDYCTFVLGLPYSQVTFQPLTGLQVEAGFQLVSRFDANVGYQFSKHWALFGQYTDLLSPFHIDHTQPDSRIFFQTHEVEAGIRWNGPRFTRFSISGGWAFGQEFSNGWDSRMTIPLRHVSDGPFARFKFEIAL